MGDTRGASWLRYRCAPVPGPRSPNAPAAGRRTAARATNALRSSSQMRRSAVVRRLGWRLARAVASGVFASGSCSNAGTDEASWGAPTGGPMALAISPSWVWSKAPASTPECSDKSPQSRASKVTRTTSRVFIRNQNGYHDLLVVGAEQTLCLQERPHVPEASLTPHAVSEVAVWPFEFFWIFSRPKSGPTSGITFSTDQARQFWQDSPEKLVREQVVRHADCPLPQPQPQATDTKAGNCRLSCSSAPRATAWRYAAHRPRGRSRRPPALLHRHALR